MTKSLFIILLNGMFGSKRVCPLTEQGTYSAETPFVRNK